MYLSHKSLGTKCSSEDYDQDGATMAAIPFNWESQPGTPKLNPREIPRLPPLTPPPSYSYSTPKSTTVKHRHSNSKLLHTFFPKRLRRKPSVQLSPASSSSSSSSRSSSPWPRAYSVPSSPITPSNLYAGNELSTSGKLFSDSRAAEKEDHDYEYSVSTPCFGGGRASSVSRGICSTILKAFLRDK